MFDLVVCHFGMSDIDDLDGVMATVARVLEKGGRFVFSIVHPCFPGWEGTGRNPSWEPGRGYFVEGWWRSDGTPAGVRTRVGANHRMMSTYINTLVRYGLAIEELAEPKPPEEWMEVAPVVGAVPVYLVVGCRKG
jgi:SAM-dependent methyltransferase